MNWLQVLELLRLQLLIRFQRSSVNMCEVQFEEAERIYELIMPLDPHNNLSYNLS